MNSDIKAFEKLMREDPDTQEKLRVAAEGYNGDPADVKAIFENILLPVAKEAGYTATFEELEEYLGSLSASAGDDLSEDELAQVAGGKPDVTGGGVGALGCIFAGVGAGAIGTSKGVGACLVIGLGLGEGVCGGPGWQ